MKIILKNAKIAFETKAVLYTSKLCEGFYCGSTKVLASPSYTIWAFKNETNNSQTWRIYNVKANNYGQNFTAAASAETLPAVDTPITVLAGAGTTPLADLDIEVTVQPNTYLYVSNYAFTDSGDMIPDISVNGTPVPLPTE